MIKFGQSQDNKFVTLRPGDKGFLLQGEVTMSQRAGFEIDRSCPVYIREMLLSAITQGFIKPVATIREHELTWEMLNK